jgi:hypothetical protein
MMSGLIAAKNSGGSARNITNGKLKYEAGLLIAMDAHFVQAEELRRKIRLRFFTPQSLRNGIRPRMER